MAKECPFKKNSSRRDSYGYLISSDKQCAITKTTFGECTETDCMAYNYTTNTCKLL
jgi:hypothetical protein